MNRFVILLILLILVSCKTEADKTEPLYPTTITKQSEVSNLDLGRKIFEGKGQCATCHKASQNVLGPSVKEIVAIYEEGNADIIKFLKGDLDPIVDPSQFQIMKINLEITKKMTHSELQAVVDYMYYLSEK